MACTTNGKFDIVKTTGAVVTAATILILSKDQSTGNCFALRNGEQIPVACPR